MTTTPNSPIPCRNPAHAPYALSAAFARLSIASCSVVLSFAGLQGCQQRLAAQPEQISRSAFFADAVAVKKPRLISAREALQRNDGQMALAEYLASIDQEPDTAGEAIKEMVSLCLAVAQSNGERGDNFNRSAEMFRCDQTLLRIKGSDAINNGLSEDARRVLFQEIQRVRSVGSVYAQIHLSDAERLTGEAEGFWDDDEDGFEEALGRVNVALTYYPAFFGERMVGDAHKAKAYLKDELATWQFERRETIDRQRKSLAFSNESHAYFRPEERSIYLGDGIRLHSVGNVLTTQPGGHR
ncbi:MAG: hypothetical protein EXS03_09735 [Phycisphaerales bacterium]|nr:hypothetical protein [Phycisphaerales bacterium]